MLYYTTYLHCIIKRGAYLLYRSRVAIWWWLNFITGLCTLTQLPWLVRSLPHQRTKPSCNFVCSLITNETVWRWGMQCIRMISLFWLCFLLINSHRILLNIFTKWVTTFRCCYGYCQVLINIVIKTVITFTCYYSYIVAIGIDKHCNWYSFLQLLGLLAFFINSLEFWYMSSPMSFLGPSNL